MSTESAKGFETLMGGVEAAAQFRNGRAEKVWVRQLPIEDYPKLLGLMEDEQKQIELYVMSQEEGAAWRPVPAGWAKTLTAQSHDELMEKAEELNRDFFGRWLRRRMGKMEAIRPGLTDDLVRGLKGQGSPSSAPQLRPIQGLVSPKSGG